MIIAGTEASKHEDSSTDAYETNQRRDSNNAISELGSYALGGVSRYAAPLSTVVRMWELNLLYDHGLAQIKSHDDPQPSDRPSEQHETSDS